MRTCFDLYRAYVDLPLWIHKKDHPESQTAKGLRRRNAKQLSYIERGTFALPSPGSTWRKRDGKGSSRQRR